MEQWKNIPGYEGLYQASNQGRIKSLAGKICGRTKVTTDRILKQRGAGGYRFVKIGGKPKTVHRLVLKAFVGKSDLQCNHKNGIKADNRIENLEWVTSLENMKHASKNGLMHGCKGEKNGRAKLTNGDIILIRKIGNRCSQRAIATLFDVSHQIIGYILNNKSWVG